MAIVPILIALLIFISKKNNNGILDLLNKVDFISLIDILKELNIGGEYLNFITPDLIESVKQGKLDLKTLLPLAIKFFASKKGEKSHPENAINTDFMSPEIKTALFNYLKSWLHSLVHLSLHCHFYFRIFCHHAHLLLCLLLYYG